MGIIVLKDWLAWAMWGHWCDQAKWVGSRKCWFWDKGQIKQKGGKFFIFCCSEKCSIACICISEYADETNQLFFMGIHT